MLDIWLRTYAPAGRHLMAVTRTPPRKYDHDGGAGLVIHSPSMHRSISSLDFEMQPDAENYHELVAE